jgi:hypothetical protein
MGQMASHFDINDYLEEHPLHSKVNKNVVGKVKDETSGNSNKRVCWPQVEDVLLHGGGHNQAHGQGH